MRVSQFFGHFFSFLFNPLFMPLLGVAGIVYWSSRYGFVINEKVEMVLLLVTAVFHCILPLLTLILMKIFGFTKKLELPNRRDRLMPIAMSLGYAAFGYYFLHKNLPSLLPELFYLLPLGSCVVLLMAFLFTSRFQISIHLMSVGALTATFVLAAQFIGIDFLIPIVITVLIAGCTGFARIRLNAHKPYQVYSGYLTGFVAHYFSVIAFSFALPYL